MKIKDFLHRFIFIIKLLETRINKHINDLLSIENINKTIINKYLTVSILTLLGNNQFIKSQDFIEQTGIILEGYVYGDLQWGDYDNDGDLDIIVSGTYERGINDYHDSKIYKNNGDGTFTEQTGIILTGTYKGVVAWGDYNNDGLLDILLTSWLYGKSKIYKNNGDNTFSEQTQIVLPEIEESSAAWGDYDNDGDLDIAIVGLVNYVRVSKIYKNNGNNTFSEQSSISLIGVDESSVSWGDYDNDGDLDLLITGKDFDYVELSIIYRNNGDNTFTEQKGISLEGVAGGSSAWGDYNCDGSLDIFLTGIDNNYTRISKLYKNNGNNSFTEQTNSVFAATEDGCISWGDYNNDGLLDLALSGWTGNSRISNLYLNNGDSTFTEVSNQLNDVYNGSIACGDYDNDQDLDILLCGYFYENYSSVPITKVFMNNSSVVNTTPFPPGDLSSSVSELSVNLSWSEALDNETPTNGLTYNIYMYSQSGDTICSSMSDIKTGFRKIPAIGNAQHNTNWTIKNLSPGKYYWSVQSIDNSFIGSQFAPRDSFEIESPTPKPITSDTIICYGQNVPNLTAIGISIKWYDNPNLQAVVHTGNTYSTGKTEPGNYTFYVTQTINTYESLPQSVTLTISPVPQDIITVSSNISCHGLSNGKVVVTPYGGTHPFTYSWDDEFNTDDSIVTNLVADRYYHVIFTDYNNCSSKDSIILSQPEVLNVDITNIINISCFNNSDGTVTVTPDGGTPPYLYTWDDDDNSIDSVVYGLSANRYYHVVVKDNNLCSTLDSIILSQPELLETMIIDKQNIKCNGYHDGQATIRITGGTKPYTYQWNDDHNTTDSIVKELKANQYYTVLVKDANQCTVKDSVLLTEPLPLMTSIIDTSHVSYFNKKDGTATVYVTGGTSPYSYQWDDDFYTTIATATELFPYIWYHVKITDVNLCTSKDSIMLPVAGFNAIILDSTKVSCFGYSNGSATVTALGGKEPYTYQWDDNKNSTAELVTGLSANRWYHVTITDADLHYTTDSIFLSEPEPMSIDLGTDIKICKGESNILHAGQGYSYYFWSIKDSISESLTVNSTGKYYVTVKDKNDCRGSDTVLVTVNNIPEIDIGFDTTICEGDSISIGSNDTGNSFYWSTNDQGFVSEHPNIIVRPDKTTTYILTEIIDSTGCYSKDSLIITVNQMPEVTINASLNPMHYKDTITLLATGALSYSWFPASGLDTNIGSFVHAYPDYDITYTIMGIDNQGCIGGKSVDIKVNCQECGDVILTDVSGHFNHGCTDHDYNNNANCSWTIYPSGVSNIYLYFSPDSFDIKPGDIIKVYNGVDKTGDLLFTFDNNNKPDNPITGGSAMHIELITNATGTGKGFQTKYSNKPVFIEVQENSGLKIYPNPFICKTIIEFPNPEKRKYRLIVTDLSGKIIKESFNISENHYELDRVGLSSGMYIVELRGRRIYRGMIVVE